MATRKSNLSIVLITGGILVIIVVLIYLFVFSVGARYNKAVGEADEHFVSSRYEQARTMYNEALTLKPGEEYPREQLAKIDSIAKARRTAYQYRTMLSAADSLFVAKNYEDAKMRYLEASTLDQDDPYPVQQIKKIDNILAEMEAEEAKPEGNFHIVVGVFENESNVEQMMEKMKEKGLNPRIVPRKEFEMQAVTYASYPDIHEAYNNLQKVQQEIDPNAWVIWHRFK
jgi:predicted negative regulator of RcsB-dependent stress response